MGSPAALYLAAAGVGRLGLVDQDVVELSNLHRQVIHNETRVGVQKAESAKQACTELNSSIQVQFAKCMCTGLGSPTAGMVTYANLTSDN